VSMGGSSIFFTSMATGMILSVSWGTKELDGEAKGEEEPAEKAGRKSGSGPGGNGAPSADGRNQTQQGRKKPRDEKKEVNEPEFEING